MSSIHPPPFPGLLTLAVSSPTKSWDIQQNRTGRSVGDTKEHLLGSHTASSRVFFFFFFWSNSLPFPGVPACFLFPGRLCSSLVSLQQLVPLLAGCPRSVLPQHPTKVSPHFLKCTDPGREERPDPRPQERWGEKHCCTGVLKGEGWPGKHGDSSHRGKRRSELADRIWSQYFPYTSFLN